MKYINCKERWDIVDKLNKQYQEEYGNYNYIFDDKISKELTEWETGMTDEEYEYELDKVLKGVSLKERLRRVSFN